MARFAIRNDLDIKELEFIAEHTIGEQFDISEYATRFSIPLHKFDKSFPAACLCSRMLYKTKCFVRNKLTNDVIQIGIGCAASLQICQRALSCAIDGCNVILPNDSNCGKCAKHKNDFIEITSLEDKCLEIEEMLRSKNNQRLDNQHLDNRYAYHKSKISKEEQIERKKKYLRFKLTQLEKLSELQRIREERIRESKLLDSDFESDIRKKLETVGITVTGITITQFMSKWSKTPFKYGKHAGTPFGKIPQRYLDFIMNTNKEISKSYNALKQFAIMKEYIKQRLV